MRIAYFTDTFLPQVNGIATSLANQAKYLGDHGHKVLIFTPKLDDIPRKKFQAKNVKVVNLPAVPSLIYTEFKFGVFGLPQVIKHLTEFKPDIIHLHSNFTVAMDALMAKKIFKKPLVGTIHVYFAENDYLKFIKFRLAVKILGKFAKRYLDFLYNQCDLLLTPSKILIEELRNKGYKKEVYYQPNGIDLNHPKFLSAKQKDDLKKRYGLKEKVILHFGRLSYEKSIDVLIKAFDPLIHHQNVSLLIIGHGPATKSLIRLTKKLGLEKSVVFTGFIDHQALISSGLLSIGDLFATASPMEVSPMVVLEAMAFGLPIVGVEAAGMVELVSDNGYLVKKGSIRELTEKMEKILFDKAIASQMSKNSLNAVKEYSIAKTTSHLLKLYQSLLKHSSALSDNITLSV
ncbi:MAG: glycosyltransferase [Patescibacteria group bacterium]